MATLMRKGARLLKRKRREEPASSAFSRELPRPLPAHFNFLGLPLEIRNMIYDTLWKSTPCVATYHQHLQVGVLADYNGTILDKTLLSTNMFWDLRLGKSPGLSKWLLTNKQMLEEGLTQFRLKAHWNIWSLMDQYPSSLEHREIPETPLMSLGYARSTSFPRLLIEHEQIHPPNTWNYRRGYKRSLKNNVWCQVSNVWCQVSNVWCQVSNVWCQVSNVWCQVTAPIITFNLNVHGLWLSDVIATLGNAPDVRTLHFSTGQPYLDFHRTVREKYSGEPLGVELECHGWFSELIKACNKLEKLEVDICRHDDYKNAEELLDTECLQQIRVNIMAAMKVRGDVSETMTETVRSGGRGMINRKCVFTRKTKK